MHRFPELLKLGCEGARDLQRLQKYYDSYLWEIEDPKFSKLRHVAMHIAINSGRIASECEHRDHVDHRGDTISLSDDNRVIANAAADLIHHACQLASICGIDLGVSVVARYQSNVVRLAPDSELAQSIS